MENNDLYSSNLIRRKKTFGKKGSDDAEPNREETIYSL